MYDYSTGLMNLLNCVAENLSVGAKHAPLPPLIKVNSTYMKHKV